MLVYDICNEKSFENIKNWIRNIEEVSSELKLRVLHKIYLCKMIYLTVIAVFIVLLCTESNILTAYHNESFNFS